jgi:hypothetical protein
MKKTTSELQSILLSGGSVIVDANDYTASSLQAIAHTANSYGAHITIKHASVFSTSQCKSIAFSGGGHGVVTFDFTD